MKTDGQSFMDRLAGSSSDGFAAGFSRIATRLGLGVSLSGSEARLLYEAAFYATLCNIAFNGLGGCCGQIKPGREVNRLILEWEFMAARDEFSKCEGWQALTASQRESIRNIFLRVVVTEDNLAL
jgi:hypothetical protein